MAPYTFERFKIRIKVNGADIDRIRLWTSDPSSGEVLKTVQYFVPQMTAERWHHMVKHIATSPDSRTAAHVQYGDGPTEKTVWLEDIWKGKD